MIKLGFLKLLEYSWRYSLTVKTTNFTHYVSYLNLKGEGSTSMIIRFKSSLSPNFKWAWQAQFLSYSLNILKTQSLFAYLQVILLYVLYIYKCAKVKKFQFLPYVQVTLLVYDLFQAIQITKNPTNNDGETSKKLADKWRLVQICNLKKF